MNEGHPDEVAVKWDLAISLLRLVDGLAKSPNAPGLSYSDEGEFEYDGEAIPEADRLRALLMDALDPGFNVGDKVVDPEKPGKIGTVFHMILFGKGWYVGVEFDDDSGFFDGTDLQKVE